VSTAHRITCVAALLFHWSSSQSVLLSSLVITYRSLRYASPHLWYQLSDSFYQSRQSCFSSPPHPLVNPSFSSSLLSTSFTLSLQAQKVPFQHILPTLVDFFYPLDCLHDNGTGRIILILFLVSHFYFFRLFCMVD